MVFNKASVCGLGGFGFVSMILGVKGLKFAYCTIVIYSVNFTRTIHLSKFFPVPAAEAGSTRKRVFDAHWNLPQLLKQQSWNQTQNTNIAIVLLSLFGAALGREVLQTMTFARASVSISPRPSHMRPPRVSHVVHPMGSPSPSPSMEPPKETPAPPPTTPPVEPPKETPAPPPTTPPVEAPMEAPEVPSPSPSPVHATITCTPELSRFVRSMNHTMSSVHVSCRSVSAFAGGASCRVHHSRSYATSRHHRGYGVYTPSSSICCQLCAHVPWCRSWSRTYSSGYCYMGRAHSRGVYHSDSCGGNM